MLYCTSDLKVFSTLNLTQVPFRFLDDPDSRLGREPWFETLSLPADPALSGPFYFSIDQPTTASALSSPDSAPCLLAYFPVSLHPPIESLNTGPFLSFGLDLMIFGEFV